MPRRKIKLELMARLLQKDCHALYLKRSKVYMILFFTRTPILLWFYITLNLTQALIPPQSTKFFHFSLWNLWSIIGVGWGATIF